MNCQAIPVWLAFRRLAQAMQRACTASCESAGLGKPLAGKNAQLHFRHVQPTAVFRRVNKLKAANVLTSLLRWEHLVKRPIRVRVQVVADQRDPLTVRVTPVQKRRRLRRSVALGPKN